MQSNAMAYEWLGVNNDFDEGPNAVNDIGPGGHYLGHPTREPFNELYG